MHYLFLFCFAVLTGGYYSQEGGASFNLEEEISRPEVVNMLRQPGGHFNHLLSVIDDEQRRIENYLATVGFSNSSPGTTMRTDILSKARRLLLKAARDDRNELMASYVRGKTEEDIFLFCISAYDPAFFKSTAQRINDILSSKFMETLQNLSAAQAMRAAMVKDEAAFLQEAEALDMRAQRIHEAAFDRIRATIGKK